MTKEIILSTISALRKEPERKFDQTVDLIINLKDFDLKKTPINLFVTLPHILKQKKICAFLENHSPLFDRVITKSEFIKFKDKKEVKKLIREYDFFAAQSSLMTTVAASFGKYLGQARKMPSPQLGILPQATEQAIKELKEKVNSTVRIRGKEPSLKISIGKLSMKDDAIAENILKIYNEVFHILPNKKENIKSILIKSTMSKPHKLEL
jgi:ribosomal protein L1